MNKVYDGIVTSQNESENNTCLNKIVNIDKTTKENTASYNNMINKFIALDNTINNLIKSGYYEMKLVATTTHYIPTEMFEFSGFNDLLNPIEYIVVVPKSSNSILVRCSSYNGLNVGDTEYIYQGTVTGVYPYISIKATAIGNKGNQIIFPKNQCELMEFELSYIYYEGAETKHIFSAGDNSLRTYKAVSNKVANPMVQFYSNIGQEFDVYRLVLKGE